MSEILNPSGLSVDPLKPIPVVLAFILSGSAFDLLRPLTESRDSFRSCLQVKPFPTKDDEDMLILQRILLNPYTDENPDWSDKAYLLNPKPDPKDYQSFTTFFRKQYRGIPQNILKDIWTFVELALNQEILIKADDRALMIEMQKEPWKQS